MRWIQLQKMLAVVALGGIPFATVSSCDYGPGGGNFYLDRNVGGAYYDPYGYDVIIEDTYYEEDVYYDDYWYEEEYWYEEDYYEDDWSFFDWF